MGIKTTIIKAGKFKAEGHPSVPLNDEAREHIQERVDEVFGVFVKALARNRGVSTRTVREDFGEGRTVSAATALEAGMIDRVATFDEVIDRVARNLPLASQKRAAASVDDLELRRRRLLVSQMT